MASQTSIDIVKQNLPDWAEELAGWDDSKIAEMLNNNGDKAFPTVRLFWLQRVSNTSALTDVSEAGSSRPLTQTHQHALDMLNYWDKVAGPTRTVVGKIKRRYNRPRGMDGLSPYGGTYARTE